MIYPKGRTKYFSNLDHDPNRLACKQTRLNNFLAFHQIKPLRQGSKPKVFLIEPPPELRNLEMEMFLENELVFVEEHGTYLALKQAIAQLSQQTTLEDAQIVVFGFNLASLSSHSIPPKYFSEQIMAALDAARIQAGHKPFYAFSIFDFAMKTVERPYFPDRLLADLEPKTGLHPDVKLIHLESVPTLLKHGIAIFPLIELAALSPKTVKRQWLYSFVGTFQVCDRPNFVRAPDQKRIWTALKNQNFPHAYVAESQKAKNDHGKNVFREIPKQSVFTLCPRGVAPWSFRTYEAILCGSIPVILADPWIPPFNNQLPWSRFSLHLPEEEIANVDSIITGLPNDTIHSLQNGIEQQQNNFNANSLFRLLLEKWKQELQPEQA